MVKLTKSLKDLWDETEMISKAGSGEGSRGGHITGHTKAGKPIYEEQVKHHLTESYRHDKHVYDSSKKESVRTFHGEVSEAHFRHAKKVAKEHGISHSRVSELSDEAKKDADKKGAVKQGSNFALHDSEK